MASNTRYQISGTVYRDNFDAYTVETRAFSTHNDLTFTDKLLYFEDTHGAQSFMRSLISRKCLFWSDSYGQLVKNGSNTPHRVIFTEISHRDLTFRLFDLSQDPLIKIDPADGEFVFLSGRVTTIPIKTVPYSTLAQELVQDVLQKRRRNLTNFGQFSGHIELISD